jgi:hypothetical protein
MLRTIFPPRRDANAGWLCLSEARFHIRHNWGYERHMARRMRTLQNADFSCTLPKDWPLNSLCHMELSLGTNLQCDGGYAPSPQPNVLPSYALFVTILSLAIIVTNRHYYRRFV